MNIGIARRLTVYSALFALLLTMLPAAPTHIGAAHAAATSKMAASPRADVFFPAPPDEEQQGMKIILSEGSESPADAPVTNVVEGTSLSEAETQAILDRLPPLEPEAGDEEDFRLPEASLPPPKTGEVIETTFPAQEEVAAPDSTELGPLEVLRYAPEGEIPLAPFLNVTFNQPMVPLGTLEQLASEEVSVVLTPDLPGTWKWLGTKTLSFEYESDEIDRFPMATEYSVEIPAGTTSAVGGELAEAVAWTFSTPPPTVVERVPNFSPQPLDPILFVAFDQRINAEAVLETINVTAQREPYIVRLASEDEIAADETIQRLIDATPDNRWLAFRTEKPFPTNTTINVAIGPGTSSAEGPRVTETAQTFSFQTYAPLRIEESRCSYYGDECPPYSPFSIIFNNALDLDVADEVWFTAEPAIENMRVNIYGSQVEIEGATLPDTVYKIAVDDAIQDIYGQTLGKAETLTFRTTAAPSYLTGPDYFITADPSSNTPIFTVHSINYSQLMVRVYAVNPTDWPAYNRYMREHRHEDNPPDPPGRLVFDEAIRVDGPEGQLTETNIDLSAMLDSDTGHLIVMVETPSIPVLSNLMGRHPQSVVSWVQVTQIGLDAIADHSELTAWATALQDGAPLADVSLALWSNGSTATTDESGVATLSLSEDGATLLTAQLGDDIAILPASSYYWDEFGWQQRPVTDSLRWYVFDDRAMYRPGEEVHVKGWMRLIGGSQSGDVGLPPMDDVTVDYRLLDSRGNEILDGTAGVNDLAGFDLAFTLPDNVNLGWANLELSPQGLPDYGGESSGSPEFGSVRRTMPSPDYGNAGSMFTHSFQVQEFRRPEFEVAAGNESEGPFLLGEDAVVSVAATYFAGGPLPNAEAFWSVTSTPSSYSPPNWSDFIFGEWIPWWRYDGGLHGGSQHQSFQGRTDASGRHYLNMDFVEATEPRPYSVIASADVLDVNRQAWNASTSLLVHPSDRYVGLRSDRTFVEQGEPLIVEAIVTDIDGNVVSGRTIEMEAARLEWTFTNGQWGEEEIEPQTCTIESADEQVTCTFETPMGGQYRITATVMDDEDRPNRTRMTRWVSGGQRPPSREVAQEEVELVPNQETYAPGDVAEILVQAPFAPAEGLLTVARSGLLYQERFSMGDGSTVLRIPIEDAHIPNLSIQVDLNGSAPRTDGEGNAFEDVPERPAFASGRLDLSIPPLNRALTLAIEPATTELAPGESTSIDLTLTDAEGLPVADGELAVVVVDEAILALTNYQLADPLAVFYQSRSADTNTIYGRNSLVLDDPALLVSELSVAQNSAKQMRATASMAADGAMAGGMEMAEESMDMALSAPQMAAAPMPTPGAPQAEAIEVRSDFNPLATFAPDVRTDENGQATVNVSLPDNLTRYRIMVVAVADGRQFGSAESNLTARMPLMVRPSAPRFLNFGDIAELPVVLQNQTDKDLSVDIVAQVANLTLAEMTGKRLTIPANDRVEVRFPAETENAGTARVRFAAVSDDLADAAQVEMPVYTPATTEAFATYGVVDESEAIVQPVSTPEEVFPQFGGLEITTSSTSLQALTDAVLYLSDYPFSSSAQLASRILGVSALRDVLSAFQAEGLPREEELNTTIQADIKQLQGLQNYDGGFAIWQRDRESVPYFSIHAAHALAVARAKGYEVDQQTINRSLDYLRVIENFYPHWYGEQTKHALSSYALYTRQLLGDVDTTKAGRLLESKPLDDQSLEAIAWLWQVLDDDPAYAEQTEAISRYINNQAVETPGAANFITSYGDDEWVMLHSNRRTDGIVLDALIGQEPESDLIPKVVNGLLAHRTQGRWANTQENVFILLALDRYFNTFESETPDFVARIWLGEDYVGEREYVDYSTDSHLTNVPMDFLVESDEETQSLIIAKDGEDGRLYYRLGLRYAPDDLDLDPLDMGFVVQRTYEALDDPNDVMQEEDGVWRIKAGARVRVVLTMVADSRRYHVALVDPLPAGLEIVNPDLAVSSDRPGELPDDPGQPEPYRYWWWGPWYQHQNLRDHQAEAFTTSLWDGVYEYTYTTRATTPGRFVVPPAKAEEMYSPEVFGRSGSDVVIVE